MERGIVIKNDENGIDVQMQPSTACESCSACFLNSKNLQILHLNQKISVKPGDTVEIEVKPSYALRSAFLLFFLPLLMMIVGYFIFANFVNIPGWPVSYQGALGGLLAVIATYGAIYFYDKHLQKSDKNSQVRIVRVVQ
ncbi:MAG TPA: hypothetical protein ENL09_00500 [Bacteroidetes bacterium]|nr:hypothetical protein [Bacteroidota bacterium]